MRILIAWGGKHGGTEGIAQIVSDALQHEGHVVTVRVASAVESLDGFDAVLVGGGLYANRWVPAARRFVARNVRALREVPTWFFSSGPLDASAAREVIAPVPQVATLMERVGALGHATFGGRLAADAKGFLVSAMAKQHAGDWRDPDHIRNWAKLVSHALPSAKPATPVSQPGRSAARLALHGVIGWAACAIVMAGLLRVVSPTSAVVLHTLLVPVVFAAIARHYFAARGAREPIATASGFVAIVAALDLAIVEGLGGVALIGSVGGFWLPLALVFGVTAAVGAVSSMLPATRPPRLPRASAPA